MMKALVIVGGVALSFALCGASRAASDKELYELQERCGKRAAEIFKEQVGGGTKRTDEGESFSTYVNHYNAKLNKCFIMVTTHFTEFKTAKYVLDIIVMDVNENKQYAVFNDAGKASGFLACEVKDVKCHSESEFDALVAPYMEQ